MVACLSCRKDILFCKKDIQIKSPASIKTEHFSLNLLNGKAFEKMKKIVLLFVVLMFSSFIGYGYPRWVVCNDYVEDDYECERCVELEDEGEKLQEKCDSLEEDLEEERGKRKELESKLEETLNMITE